MFIIYLTCTNEECHHSAMVQTKAYLVILIIGWIVLCISVGRFQTYIALYEVVVVVLYLSMLLPTHVVRMRIVM